MLNTSLSHEIQYRSMHINVWDNGNDLFQTNKMGRTCRLRSTRSLPSHSYAEKVNYWGIEILFNSEKNHRISKRRGQSHSFTFFTFVLQCRLQCDLYSIHRLSLYSSCLPVYQLKICYIWHFNENSMNSLSQRYHITISCFPAFLCLAVPMLHSFTKVLSHYMQPLLRGNTRCTTKDIQSRSFWWSLIPYKTILFLTISKPAFYFCHWKRHGP